LQVEFYEIQEPVQIVWDVAALGVAWTWKLDSVEGQEYNATYIEFGIVHCIDFVRLF